VATAVAANVLSNVVRAARRLQPISGRNPAQIVATAERIGHNVHMTHAHPRLIKLTALPVGVPDTDHPKPDRLVRGNPLRETWNLVQDHLPTGEVFCGVWRCQPGRWRIAMGPTERELFTVLSGVCRVHDATGGFEQTSPGEGLYIPPGFTGEFEVLEPLTKTYMICE
jgi:uncharacterized cupin superfamily protein